MALHKSLKLTTKQLAHIQKLERRASSYVIWKRLLVLKMKHQGQTNTQIAESLSIHRETVRRWINLFKNEGFKGILKVQQSINRPAGLGSLEWKEIKHEHESNPFPNSYSLKEHVEQMYGVSYNQQYLSQQAREKLDLRFRERSCKCNCLKLEELIQIPDMLLARIQANTPH